MSAAMTTAPRMKSGRLYQGLGGGAPRKSSSLAALKGRKVGLLTNHTGIDRTGTSTIDVLHRALGPGLVALFSPEHGIRGTRDDENIASEKDGKTGLTIHSLYGATRRPTDEMLQGLDTLVVDLADVGVRFYT